MNLQILYYLILIYLLNVFVLCHSHSEKSPRCSYERSVKVSANENGSYIYDGVEIPSSSVFSYNFTILENGTRVTSDNYTRGCICDVKKCLRICSHSLLQFYNKSNDTEITDLGYFKNVTLSDGTEREMHLVHDFYHVVGSLCSRNYSLDPEIDSNLMWTLYENGTLLRHGDLRLLSPDEHCFDVREFEEGNETYFLVNPYLCGINAMQWTATINAYAMIFSVPFFILTIILYCSVPYLRKAYGKCFICYLSSLAISYILISYVTLQRGEIPAVPCKVLGYIIYYTVIAYLTWTAVISYDTWNSFTHMVPKRSFAKYSITGWAVPLLMTIITYLAQISDDVDEYLKPGIDEDRCGANTQKWSACIYFYGPCTVVLIYSVISFISVLKYVKRHESSVSAYESNAKKSDNQRFFLYLRLFIFMGVSWIFDILSYFLSMTVQEKMLIFSIPDFFYASQGIVIFLMFVCHRQVLIKIRESFTRRRKRDHKIVTQSSTTEM